VELDGPARDVQARGRLDVRQAVGDQERDLDLAVREAVEGIHAHPA
jgi:hypothetical protein